MDPKLQTTFIPKKTFEAPLARRGTSGVGVFFVLSFVVFLGALLAAGGLLGWKIYTQQSIASKKSNLEEIRSSFNREQIQTLKHMGLRLKAAKTLLENHLAASSFFDYLERTAVSRVRYTSFKFSRDGEDALTATMEGIADSFNALALQEDTIEADKVHLDPGFSEITLDEVGNVNFSLTVGIGPEAIPYIIPEESVDPEPVTTSTTSTTSTTTSPTATTTTTAVTATSTESQ